MAEFKRDNPGGDWLHKKQQDAEHHMKKGHGSLGKGYSGPTTGYFTKTLKLPVKHIKHLPGANDEQHYRNDHESHKHKELSKSVKETGFDSSKSPILIGVNHHGKAHVLEGNHRLAHADKHGHEHIHAEVRYWNGGEDVKGQGFHPDQVLDLHHHGKHQGVKDKLKEDAAVNSAGGGAIAGIGIGAEGEPGVYNTPKKKKKIIMSDMLRRWMKGR